MQVRMRDLLDTECTFSGLAVLSLRARPYRYTGQPRPPHPAAGDDGCDRHAGLSGHDLIGAAEVNCGLDGERVTITRCWVMTW